MMPADPREDRLLTLLRVGSLYAPEPLEANDILIADGRIAALGRDLEIPAGWPVRVVEARTLTAVPAFIDQHVHVTGGGGEGGCGTRCPEISAFEIAAMGIGTVVGVLGTDSISRSPADLLAKVRGLKAEGISAYMYTGAYRVPPPTLTGDIQPATPGRNRTDRQRYPRRRHAGGQAGYLPFPSRRRQAGAGTAA